MVGYVERSFVHCLSKQPTCNTADRKPCPRKLRACDITALPVCSRIAGQAELIAICQVMDWSFAQGFSKREKSGSIATEIAFLFIDRRAPAK